MHIHIFYTYTNGHIYTYIHTYTYTHIQTYRHTDIQTYRHADTQSYRHTDITDIQTYRHIDIQTYIHTEYRHTNIHTDIHACMHTYRHTYTHTYMYKISLSLFSLPLFVKRYGMLSHPISCLTTERASCALQRNQLTFLLRVKKGSMPALVVPLTQL